MTSLHVLVCALALNATLQSATPEAPGAQAGWTVQEIESPATHTAQTPNVVRGADGVVYMTWIETLADNSCSLRVALLDGETFSPALEIVQSKDLFVNWADFPGVSALSDGTLLAYWLLRDGSKHGYSAELSLSVDHGKTWSKARKLHDDLKSGEHGFVSVVPLNDSEFLAVWLDGRNIGEQASGNGAMRLLSRTVARDGTLGDELVIDERVCDCCQTSLTLGDAGVPLVAYRDRGTEEVRDISISFLRDGGWSKSKVVRDDGWLIQGCPVNGPQLASYGDKHGIAWFTGAGVGGGRVYAAFATGSATGDRGAFGFSFVIDDGAPVGRVDLEFIDESRALVTWLEHIEGSHSEWRAKLVTLGSSAGEPFSLGRVPNERASGFLRMTSVPGGVVAAWTVSGKPSKLKVVRIRVPAKSSAR